MGLKAISTFSGGNAPLTNAHFSDGEVPGGTKNGVNTAFTLAHTPSPAASLMLAYNGNVLQAGVGYTLTGSAITAISPYLPNATNNDTYEAWYRY